jgi:hypothetical protein
MSYAIPLRATVRGLVSGSIPSFRKGARKGPESSLNSFYFQGPMKVTKQPAFGLGSPLLFLSDSVSARRATF